MSDVNRHNDLYLLHYILPETYRVLNYVYYYTMAQRSHTNYFLLGLFLLVTFFQGQRSPAFVDIKRVLSGTFVVFVSRQCTDKLCCLTIDCLVIAVSIFEFVVEIFNSLQMDLSKKFQKATTCTVIIVNSLEVDRKYRIVHARRIVTKRGPTVLIRILDSPFKVVKLFMPKR